MASKKAPHGSKTKFVMDLPRDVPAKEVVAKAKAAGFVISEAHVYKIRSTNKPDGAARGKARALAPAKPGPRSRGTAGGQSKRDFVLSFPAGTPASEVLRKANEAGIGISKAYLYTIRSGAGAPAAGAKRGPKPRAERPQRSARGATSLESQFVDAALDLGLERATQVLERVRTKLRSLV